MGEGFNWDGEAYTESAGGEFIESKAFKKLVYTDASVFVTAIREGISHYNNQEQPQWLVDFITPDGEEKTKGWSKTNEERNARMKRIAATIEATGEPLEACFVEIGQRYDIGRPKASA